MVVVGRAADWRLVADCRSHTQGCIDRYSVVEGLGLVAVAHWEVH